MFRNDGGNAHKWLRVTLKGHRSNANGIGAVVRVRTRAGEQWRAVHSGSSYCSHSELALTFGLGDETSVTLLTVEWPSGTRQEFRGIAANRPIVIDEGRGIQ